MSGTDTDLVHIGLPLAVIVVVLAVCAAAVNFVSGSGMSRGTLIATVRAAAQLAALAAILAVVIQTLWASVAFVVVMGTTAAAVSAGRVRGRRATVRATVRCLLPVAAPSIIVVLGLTLTGTVPAMGLAIIPITGILIGGAMNTTSLAGKRAHDELRTRAGEVDAALALGFIKRDARLEICRSASATALIPGLDQTRSVGLVTIPGAFVGMILGGASTTAAAVMQLSVLVCLLFVSAIAAATTVELVARNDL